MIKHGGKAFCETISPLRPVTRTSDLASRAAAMFSQRSANVPQVRKERG
jgi:hypothetical protein